MDWILVTNSKPTNGQIVLCAGTGHIPSIAIYDCGEFVRYIDTIPSDKFITIYYDKITHWMPLPELPTT